MNVKVDEWGKQVSKEDASINYIKNYNGGKLECRYVRRPDSDYFIAYLSSFNGCDRACRYCHLTQTGQTKMDPATIDEFVEQLQVVMKDLMINEREAMSHSIGLGMSQRIHIPKIHINFMARGEPPLNPYLINNSEELFKKLSEVYFSGADDNNKDITLADDPTFNISTIMPKEMADVDLGELPSL